MIRELVGSYLNLNGRGEPSQNDAAAAATVPVPAVSADIIREGFERLEEEYGTSAEEVVDAAAAEAGIGGGRTLEQELAYGDYAEKIQSAYPECKCGKTT